MPVIGAVLHLDQDESRRQAALGFLKGHPGITLGEEVDRRLAVVMESDSRKEDKAVWEEVQAQTGVVFCSMVFADFSDVVPEESL
jgi:nitrate reductase NapAB chaperone NapD